MHEEKSTKVPGFASLSLIYKYIYIYTTYLFIETIYISILKVESQFKTGEKRACEIDRSILDNAQVSRDTVHEIEPQFD